MVLDRMQFAVLSTDGAQLGFLGHLTCKYASKIVEKKVSTKVT